MYYLSESWTEIDASMHAFMSHDVPTCQLRCLCAILCRANDESK